MNLLLEKTDNINQLWNLISNEVIRLIEPDDAGKHFLQTVQIWSATRERLVLGIPENLSQLNFDKSLLDNIRLAAFNVLSTDLKIDFLSTKTNNITNKINPINTPDKNENEAKLNPKFVFNNFIVGKNSQVAYTASLSVANNPGTQFNPLFIWGNVGLGKTHLLQSIANKIIKEKPFLKILFAHSEQFLNEIVAAMRSGDTSHFKLKYRFVDVLILDDIQFIEGAEKTQIEFFHTFNTLYESGRQIVLSSDRPPKNLTQLTDRIRSRFEWGLITQISDPDLETKIKIFETKAAESGITIDPKISKYICENIPGNIRSIEGILTKYKFLGAPGDIFEVKRILNDYLIMAEPKKMSLDHILKKVVYYYKVEYQEILSKNRSGELILPRFMAIYISLKKTGLTTKEIGKFFGNRDHSTIINARKEIEKRLINDSKVKEDFEKISNTLS